MDFKIIIGWIVFAVGLFIIYNAVDQSYKYFTAKAEFPQIFKINQPNTAPTATTAPAELNPNSMASQAQAQEFMQQQIQNSIGQALGNVFPVDSVTKILNAIVWSMFATFLVYAGAKISGIGIALLTAKPAKTI